ncbi:ATP-binding protein [Algoriphagus confluentis]|uniref:ATP-binding protein n=1 Tax=Algoriphagus confluentis TaxID=1697556 RepID=A0ABQ6PQK8_9BACT|nr:ATP-binding protein [Algoriphagus confluentis]
MERELLHKLLTWKDTVGRKPLIIRGARQVGKTWLMNEFGSTYFSDLVYINFETNRTAQLLFEQGLDLARIIQGLEIQLGKSIDAKNCLLIFDEIQECPDALTSLKYFQEQLTDYYIIAAGSLLGVALHQNTSFPVGKVEFLDLYPLSFSEFLEAIGEKSLANLISNLDWSLLSPFREKLIYHLRTYYFIGGMPEAVKTYAEKQDFFEVRVIQKRILEAYEQDFSKHAPAEVVPRIRMIWNSIPSQLAKENKKFIFGQLRQGARAKEFELAMEWLRDCGLIHKISRVSKPGMPLKAYEDFSSFKVYLLDVGILGAMVDLDARTILEGNRLFTEFKGSLTEQFVLQELITAGHTLYYWSAERGVAELDFILQDQGTVVPLEVKAEENLKAKSLKVVAENFPDTFPVRTSMSDFRQESWMTNFPLYAVSYLAKYLDLERPKS